jgi:hypothetical protein
MKKCARNEKWTLATNLHFAELHKKIYEHAENKKCFFSLKNTAFDFERPGQK